MIDINRQIEYWQNSSLSDIETAGILIEKEKFLHGLFFCHLSLEKILKASYVLHNNTIAPKTHDLIYLINHTSVKLDEKTMNFLALLMKYQLEGRYPEYTPSIPSKGKSLEYLEKTKELLKWLTQKL
jgi:HEPN domain-containing protein